MVLMSSLRGIGCIVFWTLRLDESIVQGVPGAEYAMRHCSVSG